MKLHFTHRWLSLMVLAGAVAAALAADPRPTVDSVLAKYVRALGGKSAFDKVTSRTMTADIAAMGMSGDWNFAAKAPNKQVSSVETLGMVMLQDGFDGTVGWTRERNELRIKRGEELARARRDAQFNREVKMKTVYPNLVWKRTDKLDGQEVQVLESSPGGTSRERFFFSSQSGLLVRQQTEFAAEGSNVLLDVRMSDYREFDGIKYPYARTVKIVIDGKEVVTVSLKLKQIQHNPKLDDARFLRPAA
jgi:zinc protease